MNRLSLIRYTSAVALGLSTLWSAAVCAAEDAGAFDKIQQIRAGDLNIGYVDIGPRDGQPNCPAKTQASCGPKAGIAQGHEVRAGLDAFNSPSHRGGLNHALEFPQIRRAIAE